MMEDENKKEADEQFKKDLFSAFTQFDSAAGEPDGTRNYLLFLIALLVSLLYHQ